MLGTAIFLLHLQGELEVNSETKSLMDEESSDKNDSGKEVTMEEADENTNAETLQPIEGGKKDPSLRRQELLMGSGLAEVCHLQISILFLLFLSFYSMSVSEKAPDLDAAVLCRISLRYVLRMQESC